MTDESVFAAALAIGSPVERAAYLDRACAGNSALRIEVEELLAAHAASNPLDQPAADLGLTGAYVVERPAEASETVGSVLAVKFKLVERLGEGGMGAVYMAQQTEPVKRLVAVKVIREGMDSRQVLARFEAERQALALMDHPNIAKVLDAGTTETGRPFFVMELVKGVPITEFCDARKLSPRERLELFVPVCQAIQHAHQKGVIHRDIKPSNVLVALCDGRPVPKVIDFGIAKAAGQPLTDKTLVTGFGAIVGTPEYMSPEQAELNQLDIDTRSDVFALGVLLYELLTGTTPLGRARLGKAALLEVLRIVREEEPPKPSTRVSTSNTLASIAANRNTDPARLSRLMKGELDWIVMKALEKDRNRRYDTATALAKDVERHLAGDAVEACPPTLGYRFRKAYKKNRAAVLTATAFTLVLLAAAGVSLAFGLLATRAEGEAERRRDEADENATKASDAEQQAQRERDTVRSERDRVRGLLYASRANQTDSALRENRNRRLMELLDQMKPEPGEDDLRGWEWHYLARLFRQAESSMPCECPVSWGWDPTWNAPAVFSGAGHRVLLRTYAQKDPAHGNKQGNLEGQIEVRDTRTGTSLLKRPLYNRALSGQGSDAVLSPDGRFLAVRSPVYADKGPTADPPTGLEFFDRRNSLDHYQIKVVSIADSRELATAPFVTTYPSTLGFTAEGKPVFASVEAGALVRWNWESGQVTRYEIPSKDQQFLFATPDGATALFYRRDNFPPGCHYEAWDVREREPKLLWRHGPTLGSNTPKISPGGTYLMVQHNQELVIIPIKSGPAKTSTDRSGTRIVQLPEDCRFDLTTFSGGLPHAISDTGRVALVGISGTIYVTDTLLDPNREPWTALPLRGHTSNVGAMFLAGDGQRLVSVGRGDGRALTWNLQAAPGWSAEWPADRVGREREPVHPGPDGQFVTYFPLKYGRQAVAEKVEPQVPTVTILRPSTGDRTTFQVPGSGIDRAVVLLNGQRILTTGTEPLPQPPPTGSLRLRIRSTWVLWDPANPDKPLATGIGHALADNDRIITRDDTEGKPVLVLRRLIDGTVVTTIPAPAQCEFIVFSSFSPGNERLLVTVGTGADGPADPFGRSKITAMCVHDTKSGARLWELPPTDTSQFQWSPDGKQLVHITISSGNTLNARVLDAATGRVERALEAPVLSGADSEAIAFANGRLALAVGREVIVWTRLDAPPLRLPGFEETPRQILFSNDGRRLFTLVLGESSGEPSRVQVWDLTTGRDLLTIPLSDFVETGRRSLLRPFMWFEGERFRIMHTKGVRELDGTPLPESAK